MEPGSGELGARIARGAAWVVFLRLCIRSLGVLSVVILARILDPSDYGLMALATLLAATVELLSAFNFEIWLIRQAEPDRSHYDTVWTLSLIRGVVTAAVLWLVAAPMSSFFDSPNLETVTRVIAIGLVVSSLQNVGVVDFQRDMRFDREFVYLGAVRLGAFIVTVTLGVLLRNYWALAIGIVAGHVLTLAFSYILHPFRPKPSLAHWREAFDFSKWLLAGNLFSFAYMRADTFILGKVAGGQVLGLYNVAREIANLATTELVVPIRKVMFPGYSKLQDDLPALSRAFVDGFGLIMLIGTPCAVGLSLVSDPLIPVMLGAKWTEAIPMMQALAVYGVSSIGMANQWPALLALGRTGIVSVLLAFGVALLAPSFYFASRHYGAVGGALALGACNWLLFVAGLIVVRRALSFPWKDVLRVVWRTCAATATMIAAVLWLQRTPAAASLHDAARLALVVTTGALVYLGTVALLWKAGGRADGPEQAIVSYLRDRSGKP